MSLGGRRKRSGQGASAIARPPLHAQTRFAGVPGDLSRPVQTLRPPRTKRSRLAERLIRKIGALANERGVPVAAGNDGYFIAQSFEEFEPMLKRMRHQRDAMHERVQNVERLRFKLFGDKLQPSFSAILELGSHE